MAKETESLYYDESCFVTDNSLSTSKKVNVAFLRETVSLKDKTVSSSPTPTATPLLPVAVSLSCQLDWIQNHSGDRSLGVYVRFFFPEMFECG